MKRRSGEAVRGALRHGDVELPGPSETLNVDPPVFVADLERCPVAAGFHQPAEEDRHICDLHGFEYRRVLVLLNVMLALMGSPGITRPVIDVSREGVRRKV